jgi:hypothetical protein
MKKKLLFWLIGALSAFLIASYLIFGFPLLVFKTSQYSNIGSINDSLKKGDVINPLQKINFTNNCSICIVISRSDLNELPNSITRKKYNLNKVLHTSDFKTIEKIKDNFNFIYSGGDLATCESMIYIFNDNNLVFQSAIVIGEGHFGLQGQYGWIQAKESKTIIEILNDFQSYPFPILFL